MQYKEQTIAIDIILKCKKWYFKGQIYMVVILRMIYRNI